MARLDYRKEVFEKVNVCGVECHGLRMNRTHNIRKECVIISTTTTFTGKTDLSRIVFEDV